MGLTIVLCRDLMPELAGLNLEIQELKGGITNRLFRVVSSNGGDYVFRLYGAKTELFINRDVEMDNLRCPESLRVTQKLVKSFPDIYWFLSSLIQLNISTIPFDYYNYGKVKFENARKTIDYLKGQYHLTF
jgi:hypothetical protein